MSNDQPGPYEPPQYQQPYPQQQSSQPQYQQQYPQQQYPAQYPQQQYPPAYGSGYGPGGYPQPVTNPMATAGLVCGIISVVLFWIAIIGWILAILGITFGGIGLSKASRGAPNKGGAIAGIVCGVVSLLLYVVLIIAVFSTYDSYGF